MSEGGSKELSGIIEKLAKSGLKVTDTTCKGRAIVSSISL